MRTSPGYIANFDSGAAMLRATARCLRREEFPLLGVLPKLLAPKMKIAGLALNQVPQQWREEFYIYSGWGEAVLPGRLNRLKAERVAEWIVGEYPRLKYPAVMIGSANGANVHLCSALGVPWLPQTMLVPVKRGGVHPDEPQQDLQWAIEPGRAFLEANPGIELHHMHDPNQDRLMSMRMAYFRYKWTRLPEAYMSFLKQNLEPGGTIFLVESSLRWPTTKVQDRHFFQFGALGGADQQEFMDGGPRVENYLLRYGSHRKQWAPPSPDARRSEAEWGFSESLRREVLALARRDGYRVRRIVYENPHALSPLVADLYRWWNHQRGIIGNRLLVSSFILLEPYWTIRTGSVPYWMVFNKEPSATDVESYLQSSDFASIARYNLEIPQRIVSRYPWPGFLRLVEFDSFLKEHSGRYEVEFLESVPELTARETTFTKPQLLVTRG
jgi:hypothetical protein